MAGEAQYINPIIQAMIQSRQLGQQQQELQLRAQQQQIASQQFQQEQQVRQQLADQAEQQLENEAKYHQQMIDLENQTKGAQLEGLRLNARNMINEMIRNGVSPESLMNQGSAPPPSNPLAGVGNYPQIPDTRSLNLPGLGINIPLSQMPTQQDLLQGDINRLQGEAYAKSQGELPAQMTLQSSKNDFEQRMKQTEMDWDKQKTEMDLASRNRIANMENGTRMYQIGQEYGVSPEQGQAGIFGISTGQLPPNMTNPIDRRLTTGVIANGGRLPSKTDAAAFEQLGTMQDVYKKMEALADQLPDETKLGPAGSVANTLALKKIVNSPLSTDLQNSLNELMPSVVAAMHNVQGYTGNRLNSNDITILQNALSGVKTKQQLLHNEQSLKDTVNNRVVNSLESGMPNWQQNNMYHAWGVTPAWLIQAQQNSPLATQKDTNGNPLYNLNIDQSVKSGQPVWDKVR